MRQENTALKERLQSVNWLAQQEADRAATARARLASSEGEVERVREELAESLSALDACKVQHEQDLKQLQAQCASSEKVLASTQHDRDSAWTNFMRCREETLQLRQEQSSLRKELENLQARSVERLKSFEAEIESRAVNVDALEEELARVRPRLEQLQAREAQLSDLTKKHDGVCDDLRATSDALGRAELQNAEARRDLEEALAKLRRLQDLQANMALVDKEASHLRGALEGRTKQIDELLRERTNLLLQVQDAQKAMQSATHELRILQQQALSGTVTSVLVEEVEALRVTAKEAELRRDAAIRESESLKEQLAASKARAIGESVCYSLQPACCSAASENVEHSILHI